MLWLEINHCVQILHPPFILLYMIRALSLFQPEEVTIKASCWDPVFSAIQWILVTRPNEDGNCGGGEITSHVSWMCDCRANAQIMKHPHMQDTHRTPRSCKEEFVFHQALLEHNSYRQFWFRLCDSISINLITSLLGKVTCLVQITSRACFFTLGFGFSKSPSPKNSNGSAAHIMSPLDLGFGIQPLEDHKCAFIFAHEGKNPDRRPFSFHSYKYVFDPCACFPPGEAVLFPQLRNPF